MFWSINLLRVCQTVKPIYPLNHAADNNQRDYLQSHPIALHMINMVYAVIIQRSWNSGHLDVCWIRSIFFHIWDNQALASCRGHRCVIWNSFAFVVRFRSLSYHLTIFGPFNMVCIVFNTDEAWAMFSFASKYASCVCMWYKTESSLLQRVHMSM